MLRSPAMFTSLASVAVPDDLPTVRLVNAVVVDPPIVWAAVPPRVVVVGALNVPLFVNEPLNVMPLEEAPLNVPPFVKLPPKRWAKDAALTVTPPPVPSP